MTDIRSSRELSALGYTHAEVTRLVRRGELARVRRGAYVSTTAEVDRRTAHRRLVEASLAQAAPDSTASHHSAAVLHGLPLWPDRLAQVHLTRDRAGQSTNRPGLHVHGLPLPEPEVVLVGGLRTTVLARTVLDVACTLPLHEAVAIGDAALRQGLDRVELAEALDRAAGRRGIAAARRAIAFLDARSESAGESVSRVRFHQWGLPAPEPQLPIWDGSTLVARVDFGWPELGVVGEFDGREKYGRLLKPDQSAQDAVFAEKRREDAVRQLDWGVVRWIWVELFRRDVLQPRLEKALFRGGHRR